MLLWSETLFSSGEVGDLTWPALSGCWWPPSEAESRSLCPAVWRRIRLPPAPCSVPGSRTWQMAHRKHRSVTGSEMNVQEEALQVFNRFMLQYLMHRATSLDFLVFFKYTNQIYGNDDPVFLLQHKRSFNNEANKLLLLPSPVSLWTCVSPPNFSPKFHDVTINRVTNHLFLSGGRWKSCWHSLRGLHYVPAAAVVHVGPFLRLLIETHHLISTIAVKVGGEGVCRPRPVTVRVAPVSVVTVVTLRHRNKGMLALCQWLRFEDTFSNNSLLFLQF